MGKEASVCLNDPNTLVACWCDCRLPELVAKAGKTWKADDVKELHRHLKRFQFDPELSDWSSGTLAVSKDDKDSTWGTFTTRAVKMFAKHPKMKAETERIVVASGKEITQPIADKIRDWCHNDLTSPKNYWEFPHLKLHKTDQAIDAYGNDLKKGTQTAYHHYIKQIQEDFAKIGFAVHSDALCGIGKVQKPDGVYREVGWTTKDTHAKELRDLKYVTKKFQRQSKWLWRMKADGSHLPDALPGDATIYSGPINGVMDYQTGLVLHAWATNGLHMIIKKFELKELHWPPDGGTPLMNSDTHTVAKLRSDAYDQWLSAAKIVQAKGGTIEGDYASSPRNWTGGKKTSDHASAFSWHYSALAVDISQSFASGDGSVSARFKYVLEEEGSKFRIWCWLDPQPAAPATHSDDKTDPYLQYRNRNIKAKIDINSENLSKDASKSAESDPAPLGHMCKDLAIRTVREGWYLNITQILEENNLKRINRHSNWTTNAKAWEWWHYQFAPGRPPGAVADVTFGEFLQLFGVHEYLLRQKGWSSHADFEHAAG